LGADNQPNMFFLDHQFAFTMPSFDNFKIPNFPDFVNFPDLIKFDSEALSEDIKSRLEESMKQEKDKIENLKFDDDFQRNIQDVLEKAQQ